MLVILEKAMQRIENRHGL